MIEKKVCWELVIEVQLTVDDELSGGHNIDNDTEDDLDHMKVPNIYKDKKCLHML